MADGKSNELPKNRCSMLRQPLIRFLKLTNPKTSQSLQFSLATRQHPLPTLVKNTWRWSALSCQVTSRLENRNNGSSRCRLDRCPQLIIWRYPLIRRLLLICIENGPLPQIITKMRPSNSIDSHAQRSWQTIPQQSKRSRLGPRRPWPRRHVIIHKQRPSSKIGHKLQQRRPHKPLPPHPSTNTIQIKTSQPKLLNPKNPHLLVITTRSITKKLCRWTHGVI